GRRGNASCSPPPRRAGSSSAARRPRASRHGRPGRFASSARAAAAGPVPPQPLLTPIADRTIPGFAIWSGRLPWASLSLPLFEIDRIGRAFPRERVLPARDLNASPLRGEASKIPRSLIRNRNPNRRRDSAVLLVAKEGNQVVVARRCEVAEGAGVAIGASLAEA